MRRRDVVCLVCLLALAADAPPGPVDIKVELRGHELSEKMFDPRNPPAVIRESPKKGADAITNFRFELDVDFDVEPIAETGADGPAAWRVTRGSLSAKVFTTIYLPEDAPENIRRHEKAHHALVDFMYLRAEAELRAFVAQPQPNLPAGNRGGGRANGDPGRALGRQFRDEFQDRAYKLHQDFDRVTNHNRNRKITPEAAVKQVTEAYLKQVGKPAAAPPAKPPRKG